MPVTPETLELADGLYVAVNDTAGTAAQALARAWERAWLELEAEWEAAVEEIAELTKAGEWPSRAQIDALVRVQAALTSTVRQLDRLVELGAVDISNAAGEAVELTPAWEARIVRSQLPDLPEADQLAATLTRTDPEALRAIVLRTTEQVTALMWPLSDRATEELYKALVRGVALGENPNETARRLLARLQGEFNGALRRAQNICRTEMLDAHRAAAREAHDRAASTLAGWRWLCSLSTRTCPSCLSKNGTLYPLTDPGPLDHQSGRCARMPVTRTWRELGFDIDEPPSFFPDAEAWYRGLPEGDQLAIMGPARHALLDSGAVEWADLSTLRKTQGWRDSYGTTRVRDLLAH